MILPLVITGTKIPKIRFQWSIEVSLLWTQVLNCPRVLLPDGRTQVVEYKVEGENTGFIVSVR